jgi:hypothetical protein
MIVRGKLKGNTVVLDDTANLPPDGTEVVVEIMQAPPASPQASPRPTMLEEFGEFIGCMEGYPADYAAEHDHYIRGTPKRNSA